ncbi:TOBE domain-containing protein [bacterium]|nr:TOBE domain-containing protein [bacterium]
MKSGARNEFVGKVTNIKKGDVMGVAKVKIPADSIVSSVMTLESMNDLKLKKGDKVKVLIKAVSVLVVKD